METKFTMSQIDQYCLEIANKILKSQRKYFLIHPVPMGGFPLAIR